MKKNQQTSETFQLASILACVGGFLDAYTYVCRGGVFANAQTGNIVLLGVKIAEGKISEGLKYLIPIIAFTAGVFIAEAVKSNYQKITFLHWRQIIIAFEIVILGIVSFIPQNSGLNVVVNVMVSFVCSLQVQSFRKMNGNAYATTMCTGNLRSAAENLFKATTQRDKSKLQKSLQYFGVILFFIIGAILGVALTSILGIKAMLIACVGLALVFSLMFIEHI